MKSAHQVLRDYVILKSQWACDNLLLFDEENQNKYFYQGCLSAEAIRCWRNVMLRAYMSTRVDMVFFFGAFEYTERGFIYTSMSYDSYP
jgi:hypothetical protein